MSARDMSRRGTVGGGRARFQPRARGANRSFRGRGSAFLSVSSCFSSRKPAFDWELLPLLLRFVRGALNKATVILEITRNCPCVVSRSQQNNSRSRFVSFPSPQCRIRAVSLGLELHVSGARRCLARGSQEHGGQRRALVVGDGVCVGGERQQRAAVASAVPASGGSEWRRWRLREEQRTGGGICGGQRVWRVVVGAAAGGGRASWLHVPCR